MRGAVIVVVVEDAVAPGIPAVAVEMLFHRRGRVVVVDIHDLAIDEDGEIGIVAEWRIRRDEVLLDQSTSAESRFGDPGPSSGSAKGS